MKTSLLCGAALAILGLAAAPLTAQTQTTTSSSSSGYLQTSKIIGTKVKTAQGEEVGVVKDVVLDRSSGCMAYTVLSAGSTGTRVTGQSKMVAVPWSVYSVSPDMSYLTVSVERDRIYNAPVFEYSRISDTSYTTGVYSHFGVSAGVGISGGTTNTTGAATTTGATTQIQAGAYASPNAAPEMSASPAASMTPGASASASVSESATASPAASASPSKATRAGSAKTETSPVSPRHKGDQMTKGTSEESAAEATGSPSSTKGSKKPTSTESSAETSGSPSRKKSSHKKSSTEGAETSATPGGEQE
jgi:sporulation protein YlmC with PRC-barrel domain